MLDEGSEISDVVSHVALAKRTLALAMSTPIVGEHSKRTGERRDDRIPIMVITPRAMHENERVASLPSELPIQSNSIDASGRHDESLLA